MFTDLHLKNFAAFSDFRWSGHGQINVVVGENDTGKSHLLKVMYAIAKTVETNAARNGGGSLVSAQIAFTSKLRWTFQPPDLDALITNGTKGLRIEAQLAGKTYSCSFARSGLLKGGAKRILVGGFTRQPATDSTSRPTATSSSRSSRSSPSATR